MGVRKQFLYPLRSYEEARIYPNFTNKISKELIFTHLAVFDDYIRIGDNGVFEVDYMASCISFKSHNRVPAGKRYNVRTILNLHMICGRNIGFFPFNVS